MHVVGVVRFLVVFSAYCAFCGVDVWFYGRAHFPRRCRWFYRLPGGGIAAYVIEGRADS